MLVSDCWLDAYHADVVRRMLWLTLEAVVSFPLVAEMRSGMVEDGLVVALGSDLRQRLN